MSLRFGSRFGWSLLLVLLPAPRAWPGFCSAAPAPPEFRHDFQFLAGYSPVSAALIGTTSDRRFVAAGLSYSYRCWIRPGVSLAYTGEPMPAAIPVNIPGATGPNFLIGLGGGVRIKTGERHTVSLGYKFLHLSNGFTSAVNPGVDNNLFYAGFSFLR